MTEKVGASAEVCCMNVLYVCAAFGVVSYFPKTHSSVQHSH